MGQSLAKNLIHLVFSTKGRQPSLTDAVRADLHAYLAGILNDLESPALTINSVADHAHVLFSLRKNCPLAGVVMEVKRGSSKWLKMQNRGLAAFAWQNGYGAFSIGQSAIAQVKRYIADQPRHHRTRSFQDEFRTLLARYEIAFDERYVWD